MYERSFRMEARLLKDIVSFNNRAYIVDRLFADEHV